MWGAVCSFQGRSPQVGGPGHPAAHTKLRAVCSLAQRPSVAPGTGGAGLALWQVRWALHHLPRAPGRPPAPSGKPGSGFCPSHSSTQFIPVGGWQVRDKAAVSGKPAAPLSPPPPPPTVRFPLFHPELVENWQDSEEGGGGAPGPQQAEQPWGSSHMLRGSGTRTPPVRSGRGLEPHRSSLSHVARGGLTPFCPPAVTVTQRDPVRNPFLQSSHTGLGRPGGGRAGSVCCNQE